MSFLGKKWNIKNEQKELDLIEKLLHNRELQTEEEQKAFFDYDLQHCHSPFELKDMKKAVEYLQKAIVEKKKIMIFGDYDVDGVSSTVLLYDFLQRAKANVHYTLPDREKDGYGLKDYFIKQFQKEGVEVLITVDCGTSNVNEVNLANELGMTVIITDHHDIPAKLPPAFALINPKQPGCPYPNKELSGSVVVFKLVSALAPYYLATNSEEYLLNQLGIAILGLVSDCMKLTGENRILTYHGLKRLEGGKHPGIAALLESAGAPKNKITSTTVGFLIGPRINAAGRLESANHAFELLLGDIQKVETLTKLNSKRQRLVEKYVGEAKKQIDVSSLPNIIVISSPEWNVGTLGLIASKIAETYHRPTIAMQEGKEEYTASCRSLNAFDITAFLRAEAQELFTNVGGHMLAGGFTVPTKNVEELKRRIEKGSKSCINPEEFVGTLDIECEIQPHELTFETSHNISKLEPFGSGNPEPTLVLRGARILNVKPVGSKGEHLQFPILCSDSKFQAIAFRFGEHLDKINPESTYDIAFNLEINEWQGYKKLQMRVVDMKKIK